MMHLAARLVVGSEIDLHRQCARTGGRSGATLAALWRCLWRANGSAERAQYCSKCACLMGARLSFCENKTILFRHTRHLSQGQDQRRRRPRHCRLSSSRRRCSRRRCSRQHCHSRRLSYRQAQRRSSCHPGRCVRCRSAPWCRRHGSHRSSSASARASSSPASSSRPRGVTSRLCSFSRSRTRSMTPARTVFAVRSAALFLPFKSLNPRQPHFGRSSP